MGLSNPFDYDLPLYIYRSPSQTTIYTSFSSLLSLHISHLITLFLSFSHQIHLHLLQLQKNSITYYRLSRDLLGFNFEFLFSLWCISSSCIHAWVCAWLPVCHIRSLLKYQWPLWMAYGKPSIFHLHIWRSSIITSIFDLYSFFFSFLNFLNFFYYY